MLELIVAGVGVLAALAGAGFSLARRRDEEPAVLESGRMSERRTR